MSLFQETLQPPGESRGRGGSRRKRAVMQEEEEEEEEEEEKEEDRHKKQEQEEEQDEEAGAEVEHDDSNGETRIGTAPGSSRKRRKMCVLAFGLKFVSGIFFSVL